MKILQRYLAITVIKSIMLAMLLLAAISGVIELLHEMSNVGTGNYNITAALIYVITTVPQHIYEFSPMAELIGSIIGLGMLASRSELIAIRASGFSLTDIAVTVLKAALIIAILMSLLGETCVPRLRLWADNYKTYKTSAGQAYASQHGMWVKDKTDFIHIELITSPTKLYGITRYELDGQGRMQQVSRADQATYAEDGWHLTNLKVNSINDSGITINNLPNAVWNINLPPSVLKVAVAEPLQMNLLDLFHYVSYRKHAGLASGEYALSFWQRLFQPLSAAIMILIAVPFISGSLRSTTMGLKLLLGILAGFLFYVLNQFFGPMSMVYQLPPMLAALLPTLIFAIIGLFFVKKVR